MSNKAKKSSIDRQKVTQAQARQAFTELGNDIGQVRVALSWITDLIIEKGLFTQDELTAQFQKKNAEATAAMHAALNPPAPESQCDPNTSSDPSSTPIIQ
jgi:hypothetical protein